MIYSQLISSYLGQEIYRNSTSTHKKSELKKLYSDIIKINKDSPSYLIHSSENTQSFAIQLKEGSLSLQGVLQKLQNGGDSSAFSYKEVLTDNKDALTATIDTEDHSRLPSNFTLEIHQLARPQINAGDYVYRDTSRMATGSYTIILNTEEESYPIQITLDHKESNEQILKQLMKAINRSPAPVTANTTYDKKREKVRLVLISDHTGSADGEPVFFCSDESSPSGSKGLVDTFRLNQISQSAENSSFEINGKEQSTISNEFTLNNALHITMSQTTQEPIHITFASNSERILSEINTVADIYNSLVTLSYHQGDPPKLASLMLHDLKGLFSNAKPDLKECGITFDTDGYMQIDEETAHTAALEGRFESLFGENNAVGSNAIKRSQIFSLDPMKYIEDKVIVNYPNPYKEHFANPYMTSIYSGMLLNICC